MNTTCTYHLHHFDPHTDVCIRCGAERYRGGKIVATLDGCYEFQTPVGVCLAEWQRDRRRYRVRLGVPYFDEQSFEVGSDFGEVIDEIETWVDDRLARNSNA